MQTPRSVKKEGERCSRRRSRSPLRPVVRPVVKQAVPLLPVAYHGGAGFHAAEHGGAGAESDREGAVEPKCYRAAGQAVLCQQSFPASKLQC